MSQTVNVGRISRGTSIRHDPGTIKERARLYAQMSLTPVSKGAGLGTNLSTCRKSWRDSTTSIDETDFTSRGSVTARCSASPIVAPIPTNVIMSASSKNSSVELTKKE
jgi:hypothetical protein